MYCFFFFHSYADVISFLKRISKQKISFGTTHDMKFETLKAPSRLIKEIVFSPPRQCDDFPENFNPNIDLLIA